MKHLRCMTAWFLGVMLLLSACTSPTGQDASTVSTPGFGRYLEASLPLPPELIEVYSVRLIDGALFLIGAVQEPDPQGEYYASYGMWTSRDNGASWQRESFPSLDSFRQESAYLLSADIVSPDRLYLYFQKYTELPLEEGQEFPESEIEGMMYLADRETLTPQDHLLPAMQASRMSLQELRLLPDDQILANFWFNSTQVDLATGRVVHTYEVEDNLYGTYGVFGGRLAFVGDSSLDFYDLETGELSDSLAFTPPLPASDSYPPADPTILAEEPSGEAVYYANSTGLYRMLIDGTLTERLIDGELCSLGLPTVTIRNLFAGEDGSFLLFGMDDSGYKLFRYVFDPEVPATPTTELKVYSLTENSTVRQSLGQYQMVNPEVKVNYQIGVTGDDGVTTADALRTLSTEI